MMMNEIQKQKLQAQFDLLSPQIKGHCMRTSVVMQLFTEQIIGSVPALPEENGIRIRPDEIILFAREFGVYHHLADSLRNPATPDGASTPQEMLLSVFSSSRNASGCFAKGLLETMESHEEHWDGSGLPRGLRGRDIPFWGRICAIAETYDLACFSGRNSSRKRAMHELILRAGSDFDPDLIRIFQQCSGKLRMLDR